MKKRVLFINGHLNTGGVEKSLLDILRHIDLERYQVDVLLLEDLGDYVSEVPARINVRLFDLHNTYGTVVGSIKRCIKEKDWKCLWIRIVFLLTKWFGRDKLKWIRKTIFGDIEYDCVVGFRPGIATELSAYAVHGKRKLCWWHHGEFNLNEGQAREYLMACNRMNCVITVSNGCAEMLKQHFPTLREKLIVIPNMLDIADITEKANEYIPYEKQKGIRDIVTVGRLSPEKHVANAVYAAAELKKNEIAEFRWFIVGDGEEKENLERLVIENHLEKQVFFTGKKTNPYPYIKYSDLLVHTSYVESQCLAVLEAMALGVPCVITESIGPKEFAVNEENCILAEKNPGSLVEGIGRMIYEEKLLFHMRQAEYKTAQAFSAEGMIAAIQNVLDK